MLPVAGQRHRLQVRVAALETEEPQLHGAAAPDLPRGENIGVFLTLQQEPLGQAIYLAGVLVTGLIANQGFPVPVAIVAVLLVGGYRGRQHLERVLPRESGVLSKIDFAHSPGSQAS